MNKYIQVSLSGDKDKENIPYSFTFLRLKRGIDDIFIRTLAHTPLSLHVQFIDPPLTYGTTPTTYYFQTRIYLYICICVYTYLDIDSTVHWLLEKVAIQFLHGYYRSKGTIKRRRQTMRGKSEEMSRRASH